MRALEGAILVPVSLLALIGLLVVFTSIGKPHLSADLVVVAFGGSLGLASLWGALFCKPFDYERTPLLAALVFCGLLLGCAVALVFFGNPIEFADVVIAGPPLLVAVHHLLVICVVFWKMHSGSKARGDA